MYTYILADLGNYKNYTIVMMFTSHGEYTLTDDDSSKNSCHQTAKREANILLGKKSRPLRV